MDLASRVLRFHMSAATWRGALPLRVRTCTAVGLTPQALTAVGTSLKSTRREPSLCSKRMNASRTRARTRSCLSFNLLISFYFTQNLLRDDDSEQGAQNVSIRLVAGCALTNSACLGSYVRFLLLNVCILTSKAGQHMPNDQNEEASHGLSKRPRSAEGCMKRGALCLHASTASLNYTRSSQRRPLKRMQVST